MSHIRPAAVAGTFYPGNAHDLEACVRSLLSRADPTEIAGRPKAIIAPHAGYIYSGPVAASAYACLRAYADAVHRVVLIGPCHRVPLRGIGATAAAAFTTPLRPVPVDTTAVAQILSLPQVSVLEATHAEEHSLEVHLPFLQEILGDFTIVPLVAGQAKAAEVAEVLERLWGGPETLIVVSSDLSHYLDYASARAVDAVTTRAIEMLSAEDIGADQACGRIPVSGLLLAARRRKLTVATLDVRNSGDTAGDRRRVVGYGAWLFTEQPLAEAADEDEEPSLHAIIARHGDTMHALARASIAHGLYHGRSLQADLSAYASALAATGASFVTLRRRGQLRGCIGTAKAFRPLAADIAENAFAAAFADHRFPPLDRSESVNLDVTVSLLSQPAAIDFIDEQDLLARLRPGIDGLIIEADGRRALFLPQVWKTISEPREFLVQLKRKAGLADHSWPEGMRAWRFLAASVPATAFTKR
ncbi:MAG: AmmeMemoRadiSam system protein B [Rhodospirillales bacterium]|nr:AmmeMemoRadiSam system protein B [Rhodospirillales bacterium]